MSSSTRDQFLAVAQRQFSEKGFSGTSIASIAEELGLTKQALLHHFGSKEKLYGEVLQGISKRFMDRIEGLQEQHQDPLLLLEAILTHRFAARKESPEEARLIMRELLDNQDRAQNAGNWYLKPYLEFLRDVVMRIDTKLSEAEALACIYQLLGAANYITMSEPTLSQMFGKTSFKQMKSSYQEQMRKLVRSRFS